ncbi:MAG: hypothetical protein AUG51_15825 [Acidobacteria bacterium 13_1_20CM_3_53_8]|nr:MAG: hypothetical protein AUG51_15825 [Acidobacteria bacterium 13_1_20CM_3_53_8]
MPDKVLLFDCETTGKADFKRPASDPCQPRLVQLAALLVEGEWELASLNCIIYPNGFTIPDDVASIHGITTKRALDVGVTFLKVLSLFQDFAARADWFVGHNITFDQLVMQSEFYRANIADPFQDKPSFCTMRNSTDICCIPGQYGWKWPKLSEVYRYAFGENLEHAHNALHDLHATWRVYRWLKDKIAERDLSRLTS